MKPRIEDYAPAKKCRHANDMDNCHLCGTKGVSMTPLPQSARSDVQDDRPNFCHHHKSAKPCLQCEVDALVYQSDASKRRVEVESINVSSKRIWGEIAAQELAERWPGWKCEHGHYLADDYCHVCSIALVEPDYDRTKYGVAINRALNSVRAGFRGEEGEKNFQDLKSLVDLQIWKASRSQEYGDQMNDKLVYAIARDTAGRYLTDAIHDQTTLTGIAWEFMSETFREQAEALFQRAGGLDGLLRLSRDDRANADDRALAKKIIIEYGERVPRFESLDVPTEFADDGNDGDSSSRAEYKYHEQQTQAAGRAPDTETLIAQNRPALDALVRTWRGTQRLVGEAVLNGKTTREVPGVPQKTAQRARLVVLEAFRKHLQLKDL